MSSDLERIEGDATKGPDDVVILDLGEVDFDRAFPPVNDLELKEDDVVRIAAALNGVPQLGQYGSNRHIFSDYAIDTSTGRFNIQVRKAGDGLPAKTSLHYSSRRMLTIGIDMHDLSGVEFIDGGVRFTMDFPEGSNALTVLDDGRISYEHKPVQVISSSARAVEPDQLP